MNTKYSNLFITGLALWAGHFLVDFMIGIWAVYKTIAHLDLAIAGFIGGACAFGGEGMQLLFGSFSDRGYRSHLIIGGVLLAASSAFLGYSENYILLFLIFLMTCIGSGAFHPSAASLINSLPSDRKGLLMSIFQSGGGLGMAVSQLVFSYTYFAMEGSTLLLAIPSLCLAMVLLYNRNIFTSFDFPKPQQKFNFKSFFEFFKNRNLTFLYISQVCNQSLVWGMLFLLPDVLLAREYPTWICFGGGTLAFILGSTSFVIPAGFLADKYSSKEVMVGAMGLGSLIFYTFLWIPFLSIPALFMILFAMGGCLGLLSPLAVVYGNRLFPNNSGRVSACLMGLVWCVSEGIGQFGGGLLSKLFVEDAAARALGCLGILFVVGLAFCVQLPKMVSSLPSLEPVQK